MAAGSGAEHAALQAAAAAAREVLSFRLGDEVYGIDILCVQEIRSYEAPTRIAGAPAFVKGVVNLRGTIVPIVDMRLKFGIADAEYGGATVVIVLNVLRRTIGIVVDAVRDVTALAAEQIRPAPGFNSAVDADHIVGLGTLHGGDGMIIVLDIERLMASTAIGLVCAQPAASPEQSR